MSTNQPGQTLADYVVIVLSPLLIMGLVGSLIWFLLDVLYVGDFTARLRWILFFYVFGMVLVSRISMRNDTSLPSSVYGLVIAVLVWIGLRLFVEYPQNLPVADLAWAINLGLVILGWWSAHKLTWDCTFIDDDEEASGTGLLQAAGLEQAESGPPGKGSAKEASAEPNKLSASATWWERYSHYGEKNRRPHTPGIWVVYFSLAALPIFGVGQSLISSAEADRRQHAFWMMVIYVASGLGLLLTTAFLGLRRYLRQRRLQMPAAITGIWLAVGGLLILGLLVVGALLPRPNAEYSLIQLPGRFGSPDRQASRFAVKGDSPGKDEGKPGSQTDNNRGNEPGAGDRREGQGNPQGSGDRQGQGNRPGNNQSNGQRSGDSQGNQSDGRNQPSQDRQAGGDGRDRSDSRGNQQGDRNASGRDSGDTQARPNERTNPRRNDQQPRGTARDSSRDQRSSGQGERNDRQDGNRNQAAEQSQPRGSETRQTESTSAPSPLFDKLGTLLKWIVYVLIALVALYFVGRLIWNFLKRLASFTNWARSLVESLRNLWQSLFGWLGGGASAEGVAEEFVEVEVVKPFSDYSNPFTDGTASRLAPEHVIRYSFEALQAWAREASVAREPGETPLEFVERVGEEVPALAADARGLAALYVRAAYARERVTNTALGPVRRFWERLTEVAERPMSAASSE